VTLLAIDTATRSCSVGLLENDRVLAEENRDDGQTHSRHLMFMIDAVLQRCRIGVADLSAVAVTVGPGSFTGLRIGLATAKGIAASAALPLVGVMTLEALARQGAASGADASSLCPLIDARKDEVYGGIFRTGPDGLPRLEGDLFVCRPEQVAARVDASFLLIGDGALLYRDRLSTALGGPVRLAADDLHRIRAATVGRIARRLLNTGRSADLAGDLPIYIRKSDAELKLGRSYGFR
jgi:tRNA threonylcarbamoyladenosine biosynthesis protein TsaB